MLHPHALKTKCPKRRAFRDTKEHTCTFNAGLLPSRLLLSALASHQVCTPPPYQGNGTLAGWARRFGEPYRRSGISPCPEAALFIESI